MILRRRQTHAFTTVPNRIIEDESLSYEALGVLAYLLSRPHDWRVHLRQLCSRPKGGGRDRMRRIINELIAAGYVRREIVRSENRIAGVEYVITDDPAEVKAVSQGLISRRLKTRLP